ncbi:stage III sporulation protein AE [Clostridium sp. SHJSY1]|uniref:stage III sporulation protein AE n=1 Tax=Clostridium sp. SHJSY1 TaxID=2942483 RepID=UPI002874567A|nr:stage III sporulation protein AE [Clostridium sp. SHJSY1]MDS0527333.1 stage III sporulation protein AE [Clostridium sp. SHJSY1]
MKKFKRLMILIVINLIIISGNPIKVYSEVNLTKDQTDNQIEDNNKLIDENTKKDLDKLYDFINKRKTDVELMNELNPLEYVKSYIKEGKGNISVEKVLKAVVNLLFKEVGSVLKLAFSLITIAILCSLLNNLQDAFSSKSISQIAFYACYAVLVMVLSKSFLISISVAKDVIGDISNFMAAILPVLVTMISLAGGIVQATTIDPIVMGAVVIIPRIYTTLIVPLILIGFVLQFSNNLSEEHKIDNLCKLVKQSTIWMQGIIITIFIGLLTIRGITSTTIDAVTLKTTKFAVDNFVPIVGKAFSDAITSVAGYSLIIKNAISGIGLIVIILMILYPIVKMVLMVLIYKLSAALVEPISDKRITSTIAAAGDSLVLLLSTVLSVSLMFFILLAIMASAGKFVVGG